ncbi:hypothetical protein BM43_7563 (plasmid) [Burkholderia gladioli]|uniref:Uncharacterized protein n=1 Tax=Burkholderia gladioli TaxID=28095 RepID=A0AAW3FCE8_BURGA|nr:hypothetical protein [Burkholderia gladioli]AJW93593.1 hypothetical protein BM43_7563 [Burkholderia gladioli]KGC24068.1 hypothetical protein DM48_8032 [Burkholderia gladioli]
MSKRGQGRSSFNGGQVMRVGELIAHSTEYFALEKDEPIGETNRRGESYATITPSQSAPDVHRVVDPVIAVAQLEVAINRLRRRRFDVDGNGTVIDFHDRQREQLTCLYRHMIQNRIGGVALSKLSPGARFALQVAEQI